MTEATGPAYVSGSGIRSELVGAVLRLELATAGHRNALDDAAVAALVHHLESAATDPRLRAVLLTGSGDDFCSGFDIVARNQPGAQRARTGSIQRRLPEQAGRLVQLVLGIQLPVVAVVRGWAAGLGMQLVLASDFAVVADDATLWEPFAERGFTPDSGASWLLPRLVGMARAREILMLGRRLTGAMAAEWGLVHSAVPGGRLDEEAEKLLRRLAEGPTVALGLTKSLLAMAARPLIEQLADEAYAMELASRSPDFREGMAAFAQRRAPKFEGT